MKVYKVCVEDFSEHRQSEFIYRDFKKAKNFMINKMNETMKSVLDNNKESKEFEDKEYVFKTYTDKEIEKLSVDCKEYYKSIKRINDYIIELVDNFSNRLTYTYQVKYNIITEDEEYTDYTYSIKVEEFDIIE